METKEITVTSCEDCPFCHTDMDEAEYCILLSREGEWDIYVVFESEEKNIHAKCPLKKGSVTVKLEDK